MFRLIVWLILILVVVFFVVFNVDPKVKLHLLPGVTLENIPLALVIIISFTLGVLFGIMVSITQMIKLKLEIRKLHKEVEVKDEDSKQTF
ncbi:LapA family protein [Thermodesulfobacterium sp. TA1]|uniref:lipopolysaccharide assembly protein LapA domain-containing protein n=1 Tax=Thermodesulfobacterium sp. TA1 TaxID=2234087 RepID=UPI001232D94E|nr:LapA family protein [Thermodesulfobacterium sp. TA1]QER42484.1 LapA family protein [Thermodesulfobacterium sp. TA1]